jgi:hypothetical protein
VLGVCIIPLRRPKMHHEDTKSTKEKFVFVPFVSS